MLEEAPVLGGDEGLLHEVGDIAERDPDASVAGLKHVGEIRPCPSWTTVVPGLLALELGRVGQIGCRVVKKSITWPRSTTGLSMLSFLQNWW